VDPEPRKVHVDGLHRPQAVEGDLGQALTHHEDMVGPVQHKHVHAAILVQLIGEEAVHPSSPGPGNEPHWRHAGGRCEQWPGRGTAAATREADVAEAVWRAANDTTGQLRFPAGPDAVALAGST
jgi:hypothetical protein